MEALATVLAGIGPGVRVDQEVRRERRRALERLAALRARERLLLRGMSPLGKKQVDESTTWGVSQAHNAR